MARQRYVRPQAQLLDRSVAAAAGGCYAGSVPGGCNVGYLASTCSVGSGEKVNPTCTLPGEGATWGCGPGHYAFV